MQTWASEQYGGYAKLGYEMTDDWNLRGDVNVTHFNAPIPVRLTRRCWMVTNVSHEE